MWIERQITDALKRAARQRPVILLTGARQTGKTSLCQKTFANFHFVSLDLPRVAEEAELSGEQFLRRHATPLIIDEVQYAPALFRYLKATVDAHRRQAGRYVLTGSQKFGLMAGVSESLAGRVAVFDLHSLSLEELERWSRKRAEGRQLLTWMLMGGYPEVHTKRLEPERFYADYVATYLERDVRQALQVRSLRDFNRFMQLTALRTGQVLSLHTLASEVGVTAMTIKSWLSVLEASQIIYLLEPYTRNLSKRLVKSPKLYVLDTGLACFLAGLRTTKELEQSPLRGALFETLVLGQLIRWHANRGRQLRCAFYRDHAGLEVDFVVSVGHRVKLYECKWAESPPPVKTLQQFTAILGEQRILSKSLITPVRGRRATSGGVIVEDCVELDLPL